jgi:hypothetical protein
VAATLGWVIFTRCASGLLLAKKPEECIPLVKPLSLNALRRALGAAPMYWADLVARCLLLYPSGQRATPTPPAGRLKVASVWFSSIRL